MNTVTLDYSYLNSYVSNTSILEKPVILKGASTVNISLTGVGEDQFVVDTLVIDWGDGERELFKRDLFFNYRSQSIFNEILYGKANGTILGVFSHNYSNKYNTYEVVYTISIVLQKNNGQYIYIKQPVRCFWGSFYDNMENLAVINTQILPVNTNDTFLNIESKDGIVVGSLGIKGIPLLSAIPGDIEPLDILGFQTPGFLAATDNNNNSIINDIEITDISGESYFVDITLGYEAFDPFIAGF